MTLAEKKYGTGYCVCAVAALGATRRAMAAVRSARTSEQA